VAAIPALYWAGVRLADRRTALVAAGLLALAPLAVADSQLARPYVFAMLFVILAFGFLARALDDAAFSRHWIGYVAAMALAAYANVLVLPLILAAHLVIVALARPRRFRLWLLSLAGVTVAVIPLASLVLVARTKRNPLYWLDAPSWETVQVTLERFAGGRNGVILAALALAIAGALALRTRRKALLEGAPIGILAWALVPLPALFVIAQVSPVFYVGYTLPALPGVLLLVAVAAGRLPRFLAALGLVALAALFLHATQVHADFYHATGWETAARALGEERRARDPVVFDIPDGLVAAGYYVDALAAEDGRLVVPEWRDDPLPAGVGLRDDPGGYSRVAPGPPSAALIRSLERRTGTVFVMVYEAARQGSVAERAGVAWAAAECAVTRRQFGGIEMLTIRRCNA
jgi:hypothetical protein